MFDFLFKRSAKKPGATAPLSSQPDADHSTTASQRAKELAQKQAEALTGDESAAVDFILQCAFADLRLKAAEHIHSRPSLERVQQAMRNTDRRVAKLMQTRIDVLDQMETQQKSIEKCIEIAQRLRQEPLLTPNQVAELDRMWQQIGISPDTTHDFDAIRAALGQRLMAQTDLQRSVIDTLTQLRSAISTSAQPPAELEQTVSGLENRMAIYRTSAEAPTLPKHLLIEFDQEYRQFKQTLASLEQHHAALTARENTLISWESAHSSSLKVDVVKRAWHALPALSAETLAPFQERFDTLIQKILAVQASKDAAIKTVAHDAKQIFSQTLEAMEGALQDGLLQAASEHDKTLRAIDLKAVRPSESQAARLAQVRGELNRLQDWAKWGGNVSREELIKAVEELASADITVTELAKKVGSSRERWKALDTTSGSAPKALWERFDAACTTTYAPAAAHFKKLADERQQNSVKAQSLIAEMVQYAQTAQLTSDDLSGVDWKNLAGFCQRVTQSWQRFGTLDRKDKKRLDGEFNDALQTLLQPLHQQRQTEMARREKLISDVTQLNANDRSTVDTLRNLQERWQVQAKSLPLERNDEQALWQRFRSACDGVFAKRKESAEAADGERRQNLASKEALCSDLEAAVSEPEVAIAKLLRESKAAWTNIGQVPRASEQQIEQRYQLAVTTLQTQLDAHKRSAMEAQSNAMREKLLLCQTVEAAIANNQSLDPAWMMRWQALPNLSVDYERTMQQRFQAALDALQSGDRLYVNTLEKNSPALSLQLLRLEIVAGLDSPPEFSKERLKMQVEVLQSSLKSGQKPMTQQAQLLSLCSLPALADTRNVNRIEQLLKTISA